MDSTDPAPTMHLIRGKASVVQPPPVEEFSRAACCCRPGHNRNRFDDFLKLALAACSRSLNVQGSTPIRPAATFCVSPMAVCPYQPTAHQSESAIEPWR